MKKVDRSAYGVSFNRGYNDAMNDKPFHRDYDNWPSGTQISYEKGRHLAVREKYEVTYDVRDYM